MPICHLQGFFCHEYALVKVYKIHPKWSIRMTKRQKLLHVEIFSPTDMLQFAAPNFSYTITKNYNRQTLTFNSKSNK
jgi:hypothetical protein